MCIRDRNMDLQGGSLQISTEVIAKIARCAALEVEGVAEVSCGTQNKKLKDLLCLLYTSRASALL